MLEIEHIGSFRPQLSRMLHGGDNMRVRRYARDDGQETGNVLSMQEEFEDYPEIIKKIVKSDICTQHTEMEKLEVNSVGQSRCPMYAICSR